MNLGFFKAVREICVKKYIEGGATQGLQTYFTRGNTRQSLNKGKQLCSGNIGLRGLSQAIRKHRKDDQDEQNLPRFIPAYGTAGGKTWQILSFHTGQILATSLISV